MPRIIGRRFQWLRSHCFYRFRSKAFCEPKHKRCEHESRATGDHEMPANRPFHCNHLSVDDLRRLGLRRFACPIDKSYQLIAEVAIAEAQLYSLVQTILPISRSPTASVIFNCPTRLRCLASRFADCGKFDEVTRLIFRWDQGNDNVRQRVAYRSSYRIDPGQI